MSEFPTASSAPLTIERIELVAIRVPLDRTYRGSKYRMTHRSTIITRVHTAAGIVGEAYAGDEDAGLEEIAGIIRDEIAPQPHRRRCPGRGAVLGAGPSGDLRHPSRSPTRPRGVRLRRHGDLGRRRQGGGRAVVAVVGWISQHDRGHLDRRVLRHRCEHRRGGRRAAVPRPGRDEVQGRRAVTGGGRRTVHRGAPGGRRRLHPDGRRQPGLARPRGRRVRPPRCRPRSVLVRGAVHLVERPAGDAGRAVDERPGGVCRPERVLGGGLSRPVRRRRRRLLQLRRVVVGWPDGVATGRRDGRDVRGAHGPPRGGAGVQPPAVLDPSRDVRGDLPCPARPDLALPHRQQARAL